MWGAALSAVIRLYFSAVSYAVVSSGFKHDPAGLICDLQNNDPALLLLF
jgi:hypothetical protein